MVYCDGDCFVCFAFSPPQAGAVTDWLERQKLLASDGAASDYFGYSVSISGDYAIVGAIDDDSGTPARLIYSGGMGRAGASSKSLPPRTALPVTALAILFLSAAIMQSSGRMAMTTATARLIYSNGMGQTGVSSKSLPPRTALPVTTLAILFLSAAIMQSSGRMAMTTRKTPARLIYSSGMGQAGASSKSLLASDGAAGDYFG